MLRRHPRLWCDLAFRSDHVSDGRIDPRWREAFVEFPDRFLVGTDTFTPERWYSVVEHANWSRRWLATLPAEVAEAVAWRSEPARPAVGEPFVLRVRVCRAAARLAAVDATLPEHRHGMNDRPSLTALGEGHWRADGLLWHMAGRWELRFDVAHEGRTETVRSSVRLR
jgi:hypothetical protein